MPISPATEASHWSVYGHDWAVEHLRKSMRHGRNRQAYLFSGTPSIGKTTFAQAFAGALHCTHADPEMRPCGECNSCKRMASGNHPDMLYPELDPVTGALRIEALRDLMRKLSMKPFVSRHRVAIISNFERARGPAQDAILKTLEEPPPYAVILLLANSTEHTLATIQSRCQIVYLRPVASEVIREVLMSQMQTESEQAGLIARLSGGRIGWAFSAATQPEILQQRTKALDMLENLLSQSRRERFATAEALGKDKDALRPLLELWQTYLRDLLLMSLGSPVKPVNIDRFDALEQFARRIDSLQVRRALDSTAQALSLLETNTNVRLLLEVLMLDYPSD